MNFLSKIIPNEGYVCVAVPYPKGGFKHTFYGTVDEAQEGINTFDKQGKTVFVAQATFETKDSRKQANALYLQNFFLDIDCGPDKDYPSQKAGVEALKAFVDETTLPMPAVVSTTLSTGTAGHSNFSLP